MKIKIFTILIMLGIACSNAALADNKAPYIYENTYNDNGSYVYQDNYYWDAQHQQYVLIPRDNDAEYYYNYNYEDQYAEYYPYPYTDNDMEYYSAYGYDSSADNQSYATYGQGSQDDYASSHSQAYEHYKEFFIE